MFNPFIQLKEIIGSHPGSEDSTIDVTINVTQIARVSSGRFSCDVCPSPEESEPYEPTFIHFIGGRYNAYRHSYNEVLEKIMLAYLTGKSDDPSDKKAVVTEFVSEYKNQFKGKPHDTCTKSEPPSNSPIVPFVSWDHFNLDELAIEGAVFFQYLISHCYNNVVEWPQSDKSLEYELGIGRRRLESIRKLFIDMGFLKTGIVRDRNNNQIRAYQIDFTELTKLTTLRRIYREQNENGEAIDLSARSDYFKYLALNKPPF